MPTPITTRDENLSFIFSALRKIKKSSAVKSARIEAVPINPSSSPRMENIKSVCASGR
jgi:hypothetical protein